MLSWEDDVEAHALRQRGWSISAIARHLGHDRKTVRACLRGDRRPGRRASRGPDVMVALRSSISTRCPACPLTWGFVVERVTRIELALSAWELDRL